MELFEYWWEESQQYNNPGSTKKIAKEAWEAAKSLYSESASHQADPADGIIIGRTRYGSMG